MSTVKALLVRTDGQISEVDFEVEGNPYFTAEQFIGGYTELVRIAQIGDDILHLIVNEQGHLLNLPLNALASKFYPAPGSPSGLPPGDPPIVGDVLFLLMHLEYSPEPDWVPVELNDEARAYLREQGVEAS